MTENNHNQVELKSMSASLVDEKTSVSGLDILASVVISTNPGTSFVPTPSLVSLQPLL